MNVEEAMKVIFETENKDFFRGYNYATVHFVYWFWKTVKNGDKVGSMIPEIQEIRDWIIDHRDENVIV